METLKSNELIRIINEFIHNDYQRRFNVKLETVVAAIIGEDNLINEMPKLKEIQKEFLEKKRFIQTYYVLTKTKQI